MSDNADFGESKARAHASDTGVVVSIPLVSNDHTVAVARFSWVEGVDVMQWAEDYAAAINRADLGSNEEGKGG